MIEMNDVDDLAMANGLPAHRANALHVERRHA